LTELEAFLKNHKVWYQFIDKPQTIHTEDASKVTGIPLHKITKNIICQTPNREYVLIILPGDRRINLLKTAAVIGVRKIIPVPFEQAEAISGYPPGGTPSVGHKTKMKVIFDQSLLSEETIFCGGGARDKLLELRTQDVIALNNAIIADICE